MALSDLGTPALTWRRLGVLLRQLPIEARTVRITVGDQALWSQETYMLANVVDLLSGANWQRGGGKGRKPKPMQRPGQKPDVEETRLGTPIPLEELREILDNW